MENDLSGRASLTAPRALFDLAAARLDSGDVDGAAVLIAQLAAGDGGSAGLWLQARLAAARHDPAAVREILRRLLRDPELSAEQRAEALLLQGLALGDLGQSAAAFAAALEGKRIQRAHFATLANSREGEVAKLRRLAAWIASGAAGPGEQLPTPAPREPGSAAGHVFLLGFPRSGTTLLEQMLAAHPDVVTLEEEATLATAYQAFLADTAPDAALARLSADEAAAWVQHYWQVVRGQGIDVRDRVFVDKQPAGTLNLPVIARLFPQAKILFALRDPRDVVLSCFRQAFAMNAMTYAFTDLLETALCYDACMVMAAQARVRFPLAWADVRHEQLVDDADAELARIAAFLGLAPDPEMRDYAAAARKRVIRTPSAIAVRAGLNRDGVGRWHDYRRELEPVMPVLARWVERLEYSAT